ncbi:MAG: sugar kinase [Verrucomicrobiales bacterium]|nr:sugar kinase [Verrucomicrobiales bacterium]MCP5559489.1 sugar kinase [Verrucomicrobiaceae bacterium]
MSAARIVTFGEIMGRISPPGVKRLAQAMPGEMELTFAGAEASVAMSLAYLGSAASFVTALPNHAVADAVVANLRAVGVDTQHVVRTNEGRLGLYFYEKGANQRAANVIYDRDGSSVAITPAGAYDWSGVLAGAEWFLVSGITPAISRNAAEVTRVAMATAVAQGVKIACDMNYRSKLWQWDAPTPARELATRTMRDLMPMVDLFIGGREDAVAVLKDVPADATNEDLARRICAAFPQVKQVAMTLREGFSASQQSFGGMLYDAAANQTWSEAPYLISDVVDRLGAGDAFTAGLLFALTIEGLNDPSKAIAFATAAGCLAHSIEGDFNYCSRAEIEALVAGGGGGRVIR